MNEMDLIRKLPFDLVVLISKKLSATDIYQCSLVCHKWRSLFTCENILNSFIIRLSHFDQEPLMFKHLPIIHRNQKEKGNEGDEEDTPKRQKMHLEEVANMQWMKDSRVLNRMFSKLMNRKSRWCYGEPTTRLYLPPVPLDGTDQDIRDEWQGQVKLVKLKYGIVAVLYEGGTSIRLWYLDTELDEVKAITDKYVEENKDLLKAQTKYSGPQLPSFTSEQVDTLLRCSRSGEAKKPVLKVIRLKTKTHLFDYMINTGMLATAGSQGVVDLYSIDTGKHQQRFQVESREEIGLIHIWKDYVMAAHGSRISIWNYKTGERLENGMQTAHQHQITGAFILDNVNHVMSVDEAGFIVITNRQADRTDVDWLMNVPLYPMIIVGQAGAPYGMRLLHMAHLCVWGKYSLGHYELYEPGLQNLPDINSLIINNQPQTAEQEKTGENEEADVKISGAQRTLAQLEATHADLEKMYSHMAGDIDEEHPEGLRIERRRRNRVAAEDQYHLISIDSPFTEQPDKQVLCVDFRHVLFDDGHLIKVCDIGTKDKKPRTAVIGIHPVDPLPKPVSGPIRPLPPQYLDQASLVHEFDDLEIEDDADDQQWRMQPNDFDEIDQLELNQDGEFEFESPTDMLLRMGIRKWPSEIPTLLHRDKSTNRPDYRKIYLHATKMAIGLRVAIDVPSLLFDPQYSLPLLMAKEFLDNYLPNVVKAIEDRIDEGGLVEGMSYYGQQLMESLNPTAVLNVDHRGQQASGKQLDREMCRMYRALGKDTELSGVPGFVSRPMNQLFKTAVAMDDSRIVCGCENGYVVVTSFD